MRAKKKAIVRLRMNKKQMLLFLGRGKLRLPSPLGGLP
jgi:hypothetical protein